MYFPKGLSDFDWEERAVRPAKKVARGIKKDLEHALREVLEAIQGAGERLKNPVDPEWRRNQKYEVVLEGIGEGLRSIIKEPDPIKYEKEGVLNPLFEELEKKGAPMRRPQCEPGSREECHYQVMRALQCLNKRGVYRTERGRYQAFISRCEKALNTRYYRDLMHTKGQTVEGLKELERSHFDVAVLHALALAQFTRVEASDFTESVAEAMAQAGGYEAPVEEGGQALDKRGQLLDLFDKNTREIPRMTEAIAKADFRHKIAPSTEAATAVKASNRFNAFNPLKEGNPAYIKYELRLGDRKIKCIRMPTATVGAYEVSPLFKAYGRSLKSRGLTHTYFNFQDRREKSAHRGFKKALQYMGFIREDLRAHTLEKLDRDPEFKGVFTVFSFDVDSPFYHQRVPQQAAKQLVKGLETAIEDPLDRQLLASCKQRLKSRLTEAQALEDLLKLQQKHPMEIPEGLLQSKESFIQSFKGRVEDEKSFYLSQSLSNEQRKKLGEIIEGVGRHLFAEKETLSPLDRQDLILVAYDLMWDYLLATTQAHNVNFTCKECADRGSSMLFLKLSMSLLKEILNNPDREHLDQHIDHLATKMNEDALWARKREAIDFRMARMVQTLQRLGGFARVQPERLLDMVKEVDPQAAEVQVIFKQPQESRRVRHFDRDFKRLGEAIELRRTVRKIRRIASKLHQKILALPAHLAEAA